MLASCVGQNTAARSRYRPGSWLLRIIWLHAFTTLVSCQLYQPTIKTGPKATLAETLDQVLTANIAPNEPGLIIRVVKNDQRVYHRAIGLANSNTNVAIDEYTPFRIASLSKPFTAMAILQLVERKAFALTDKVTVLLPELPSGWAGITVHHLLSHQSGIPDFYNDVNFRWHWWDRLTNENVMDFFRSRPKLEFAPGSRSQYSNTGYLLLANLIERVSGESFDNYLTENIFQPLGMSSSFIYSPEKPLPENVALNFGETEKVYGRDFRVTGTGSQFSSLVDLERFVQAVIAQKLLTADSYRLMKSHHAQGLPNSADFGYGFVLSQDDRSLHHNGKNDGYRSYLYIEPDTHSYVLMLGNGGDTMPDFDYLKQLIRPFMVSSD